MRKGGFFFHAKSERWASKYGLHLQLKSGMPMRRTVVTETGFLDRPVINALVSPLATADASPKIAEEVETKNESVNLHLMHEREDDPTWCHRSSTKQATSHVNEGYKQERMQCHC